MFGFIVFDKDGNEITERDYSIGCFGGVSSVGGGQRVTLPATSDGSSFKQIYIPVGDGFFTPGINMDRQSDGALIVNNNSGRTAYFARVKVGF